MNTPTPAPASTHLDVAMLHELAAAHGIGTSFSGWDQQQRDVDPETLVKILAALGVPADTQDRLEAALAEAELAPWRRMLPPAVVSRAGADTLVPVHVRHGEHVRLWIEAEDGGKHHPVQRDIWVEPRIVDGVLTGRATFGLPRDLPLGWHTLHAVSGDTRARATLVVVPQQLSTAQPLERQRGWGLAAQLYSVRSKRSWGIGDFADLADLAALGGGRGADFVLVNPLHAAEPVPPVTPSPYSPSTRRFFNPLYLRIEAVPELAYLKPKKRERLAKLAKRARRLNKNADMLDRDSAYAAKLEALELLYEVRRSPARQAAFEAFRAEQGSGLADFALWCALREELGPEDPFWQDPAAGPGSARARELRGRLDGRIGFHCWLQWLCDEQLEAAQRSARAAGMRLGVVHDLAVGADLASADAWTLRPVLAPGVSVGAPPDMYNQQGQNWSQPPWHPQRLAEAGYAPFRDMLSTVLRHAGGVRVDHVLGLFRLWWVPEGNTPDHGAYVYYDHDALVGILALEAQRAGAIVVGEDLGTVEPWVRGYLAERGILGTSILWFENDGDGPLPPERYRTLCLASVNTHDLPPTAGYLAGEHVSLRQRLGLLNRALEDEQAQHEESLAAFLDLVRRRGLLPQETGSASGADGGLPEQEVIEALHRLLAQSPSVLLQVSLVDAVGERRAQNQPGTRDEYPNWQVPLGDAAGRPVLLEDLAGDARFDSLLAAVRDGLHQRS